MSDEPTTSGGAGDPRPRVGTVDSQPATTAPVRDVVVDELEGITIVSRSFGRQTWDRLRRHKIAMASGVLLILLGLSFWLGPILSPYTFTDIDVTAMSQGPTLAHPFGTDEIGRDLMVRTFQGGRFSLRIALVVALLTTLIGTVMGAFAGYFGGIVDTLISQVINLFLIVPALVVLLIVGIKWGASPNTVAVLLAFLLWPSIARVVRGLFLQFRDQEFVLAAKAAGARAPRIMLRHIIPNTFGPIVVNATLLIGTAIILESTLSFLGLGVKPPTPTLGNLVQQAKGAIDVRPSKILIPGGFVVLIALCVNFLGDGLRDALDPTSRRG